jgi:hypothetical protein
MMQKTSSFIPKTNDWRKLPIEARQALLDVLQKQAPIARGSYLTRVELAQACGIIPDDDQRDLLESEDQQIIMNCCRQFGKSTISAILSLHQTCFVEDSLTLVLAPSSRQSGETYRKVREFYAGLKDVPEVVEESQVKLELANGSRVQVLPGSEATVRGFSDPALIIVDEAARVPDDLYQAIRPMLAVSGGRLVLMSTPFGSRGFFWKEWSEGGEDWKRVRVTGWQCPRISNEWLEKEKERIGSWWFSQEYETVFVDSLDACFSTADILAAITSEVKPLWAL